DIVRVIGIFCDGAGFSSIHYGGLLLSFAPHGGRASGHLVVIGKPELPAAAYLSAYFEQVRDRGRA
ncbi:MAG TPA: hypothetical protein DCP12_02590, partial [Rhodobiaceae bacterium]|nr:hypothetical protein [Rhodobiaceae bacterium]